MARTPVVIVIILYFDRISIKSLPISLQRSFVKAERLQERNATEIAEIICRKITKLNPVAKGKLRKNIVLVRKPAITLIFSPYREAMSPVGISAKRIET